MKKYFSLASALMLALSMGMTSCSNDLDEVQAPAEQQPETHILYLNASAPDAETRAYVDGVAGKDAIKITGWKQDDVLKGWWVTPDPDYLTNPGGSNWVPSAYGSVTFKFNAATQKFESESTTVALTDIKFVTHGLDTGTTNVWGNMGSSRRPTYTYKYLFSTTADLQVDLDNHFTNIPLCAVAPTVSGDELVANMQLPNNFALVCIHNASSSSIAVTLCTAVMGSSLQYTKEFRLGCNYQSTVEDWTSGSFDVAWRNVTYTAGEAAVKNIGVGEKAYLPFKVGQIKAIYVNGTEFKDMSSLSLTAGKVYKATYTGE